MIAKSSDPMPTSTIRTDGSPGTPKWWTRSWFMWATRRNIVRILEFSFTDMPHSGARGTTNALGITLPSLNFWRFSQRCWETMKLNYWIHTPSGNLKPVFLLFLTDGRAEFVVARWRASSLHMCRLFKMIHSLWVTVTPLRIYTKVGVDLHDLPGPDKDWQTNSQIVGWFVACGRDGLANWILIPGHVTRNISCFLGLHLPVEEIQTAQGCNPPNCTHVSNNEYELCLLLKLSAGQTNLYMPRGLSQVNFLTFSVIFNQNSSFGVTEQDWHIFTKKGKEAFCLLFRDYGNMAESFISLDHLLNKCMTTIISRYKDGWLPK